LPKDLRRICDEGVEAVVEAAAEADLRRFGGDRVTGVVKSVEGPYVRVYV